MGEEPRLGVFSVEEAAARLAELLERAAAGEEVIITRDGEAPMKLTVEVTKPKPKRVAGKYKGLISIPDDFFDPMTEEELALWYDGDI